MNEKQITDLIERMRELGHIYSYQGAKKLILEYEKLNKPEKVKVPEYIEDWIFKCQLLNNFSLSSALDSNTIHLYAKKSEFVKKWLNDKNNQELFARAWLTDYEAEEEKRYEVILCNGQSLKTVYRQGGDHLDFEMVYGDLESFTRKRLEEAGFGWVFDCPGIEIEEVE